MPVRRSAVANVISETLYGIDFPSNVTGSDNSSPIAVLKMTNLQLTNFPIRPAANEGLTCIARTMTRQHTGYYVGGWCCQDNGTVNFGDTYPYWNLWPHLYPQSQSNSGEVHNPELAMRGGDFRNSLAGGMIASAHGQVRVRATRFSNNGDGTLTWRGYENLPDLSNAYIIERSEPDSYGATLETGVPWCLCIGDSPWFASYQHERFSGVLYAIKIIRALLTEADTALEAADMSRIVTAAGAANVWYFKPGFRSLSDLTCSAGTGRAFTRVDSSNLLQLAQAA